MRRKEEAIGCGIAAVANTQKIIDFA